MHTITLKVTGLRSLSFRIWCAAQLFKLGGWIAGCNIVMTDEPANR